MAESNIPQASEPSLEDLIQFKEKLGLAYITINRPDKMNSLNTPMFKRLVTVLKECDQNKKVKVIIIKSTGDKVFSAGFDLSIFKQGFTEQVTSDILGWGRDVSRSIFFTKKPVVAQMQGSCVGLGCIMALSCDFRFMAKKPDNFMQLPELALKIFPATGPTAMAVNILGIAHAKDMLFTGRKIPIEEFDRWGGFTKLCEPDALEDDVKKFARALAENAESLLYETKTAINIMSFDKAKDWYDLENEMAVYYFNGLMGKAPSDLDEFLKQMWQKYGKGNPFEK
jgi:enoyl-CoA hydratase/carnithine racemase